MAARIPDDLLPSYPPSPVMGEHQCKYFRNKCPHCHQRYKPNEIACIACNQPRPRCGAKAVEDSDACRAHTPRGVLSIYTLSAGRISEQALEEVIETDERSVDGEIAIGKILFAQIIENEKLDSRAKLKALKEFLEVLMLRKKLESGDELEIRIDDKTAEAIRRRFKMLIASFTGALAEFVPDPETRRLIMERVRTSGKLAGRFTATKNNQALAVGDRRPIHGLDSD